MVNECRTTKSKTMVINSKARGTKHVVKDTEIKEHFICPGR
jgi:hypothetical protein